MDNKLKEVILKNQSNIDKMKQYIPFLWYNNKLINTEAALKQLDIKESHMEEAEQRWNRFAPLIEKLFIETKSSRGVIESALVPIENMKAALKKQYSKEFKGRLYLKCDNELPIAGSIKARGGIYEVLKYAEKLACENGLIDNMEDDYSKMLEPSFRSLFGQYTLAVGSTGNLGLSIGITGAALGFKVNVHMSADAKQWKKELLRSKGVNVIEYESDYSKAVEEGRRESQANKFCHFIDDENSKDLFLGYSTAAYRLKEQLRLLNISVDKEHPLFVYLPCGVGGAPGGICFGLKSVFGDNVHCFFAEPTHSPCMLLGLMTGQNEEISVRDIDLDNITEADGLAVGRPSGFVGKIVESLVSGAYTMEDKELFKMLVLLRDSENIKIEPSAAAGLLGPIMLADTKEGLEYIRNADIEDSMKNATHIAWATGGIFVPEQLMQDFYTKGKSLLKK